MTEEKYILLNTAEHIMTNNQLIIVISSKQWNTVSNYSVSFQTFSFAWMFQVKYRQLGFLGSGFIIEKYRGRKGYKRQM
jgi:hypothetical protein